MISSPLKYDRVPNVLPIVSQFATYVSPKNISFSCVFFSLSLIFFSFSLILLQLVHTSCPLSTLRLLWRCWTCRSVDRNLFSSALRSCLGPVWSLGRSKFLTEGCGLQYRTVAYFLFIRLRITLTLNWRLVVVFLIFSFFLFSLCSFNLSNYYNNKTGSHQCTRAVCSTAEIYSFYSDTPVHWCTIRG